MKEEDYYSDSIIAAQFCAKEYLSEKEEYYKNLKLTSPTRGQIDITKVQHPLGHRHITTTQIYDKRRAHRSAP
jgi:hypothetical protein